VAWVFSLVLNFIFICFNMLAVQYPAGDRPGSFRVHRAHNDVGREVINSALRRCQKKMQ